LYTRTKIYLIEGIIDYEILERVIKA